MCNAIDYCQGCEPNDFMVAWTVGRHHKMPEFGDGAQQYVASRKRRETYQHVLKNNSARAMEFPEYLNDYPRYGHVAQFSSSVTNQVFKQFVEAIPAFARYTAENPNRIGVSHYGRNNRSARKKSYRTWRQDSVREFLLTEGGVDAMRQMYALIPHLALPEWLTEPAPMAMVA